MAFKRANFNGFKSNALKSFSSQYKFSKQADFKEEGKEVYVIPLGLENGFYESPCHRVKTHKVNGQVIGFKGLSFDATIKCKGIDEDGSRVESLCCTLAAMERERFPENEDYAKRIVSSQTWKVHIPVLILGNCTGEKKKAFPISDVGIINEFKSEEGPKFSYLEFSKKAFTEDIIGAYGQQLKEEGVIDYDMDPESDEYMQEIQERLSNTIIKIKAVKSNFAAPAKSYTFYPLSSDKVATRASEKDREALKNYKTCKPIVAKVNEFLTLFDVEVDNLILDWKEKELQEYYNSALGKDLKAPINPTEKVEVVKETIEVIKKEPEHPFDDSNSVDEEPKELTEDDFTMLDSATEEEPKPAKTVKAKSVKTETKEEPKEETKEEKAEWEDVAEPAHDTELDDFSFDSEDGDDFFNDEDFA